MKRFTLLAVIVALSACSQNSEQPAPEPTETATVAAAAVPVTAADYVGTWEATMADGSKGSTVINADGSYIDNDPKAGETKGKFAVKDGKACFAPDNGKAEQCWTLGSANADGAMPATADDGAKITVKKTA